MPSSRPGTRCRAISCLMNSSMDASCLVSSGASGACASEDEAVRRQHPSNSSVRRQVVMSTSGPNHVTHIVQDGCRGISLAGRHGARENVPFTPNPRKVLYQSHDMAIPFYGSHHLSVLCGRTGPARHQSHHHLRSEEHTSELQSRQYLVCRLLLDKKKK